MMATRCTTTGLSALTLLVAAALPGRASAGENVDWIVAPYLWLPTITVDLADGEGDGGTGGGGENFFPDVLDELDGAFLGYAEVQGDHWGGFVNFLFLGLESDEEFDIALTSSDLDATIIDAAAVYSFDPERFQGFEIYGGLRYVDIDYAVGLDFTNPAFQTRTVNFDDSYSDFLFGGRYRGRFADRWGWAVEADGSTGDTEGTFSVGGRLLYHMDKGAWVFGWRYLDGEIETDRNALDVTLNGPVIGYAFRF